MSGGAPRGTLPARAAGIEVRTGDWYAMRADAAPIRLEVFVVEQGCPESEEWDAHDARSVHAVAYVDGAPVATGRLLPEALVGRMAVRAAHRGTGVGARVLLRLLEIARARGDTAVELSSQCHAIGFYARHDFVAYGEVYDECGIPHRKMRRALR